MLLTKCRRRSSIPIALLTLPLLVSACEDPLVARRPTAGGSTSASRELRWYESIDNTPTDPERRRAGEPDFADRQEWVHPLTREQAMEILLRTDWFCSGGIAYGLRTPNQCYAFKAMLKQPDAPAAFESLLHRGGPAGQLYGLCGLYLVDRPRFDLLVKPYVTSGNVVGYLNGCVGDSVPISQLVASDKFNILNGDWPNVFRQVPDRPVAPQ